MYYKGYKIRLLPTPEQEQNLKLKCNISRFVWNWCLAYQMKNFENGNKYIKRYDFTKIFVQEKNNNEDLAWLRNHVGSIINLRIADLDKSFHEFFEYRKSGGLKYSKNCKVFDMYHLIKHPKFKSKRDSNMFPMRKDRLSFYTKNNADMPWKIKYINHVNIENIGYIKFQTHYDTNLFLDGSKIWNPRISLVNGKWILSFTVETDENQVQLNNYSCGVDVGIKNLATVSCNGEVKIYKNINKTAAMKKKQKKLKRLQRTMSKCQKYSKRRQKAKNKYSKYSKHLSNIRQNYIHNCSADIIKKLPERIIVESVKVKSWQKAKLIDVNREVQYSNVYEFLQQLEYKSHNNGIKFIKADKYYPSTQLCSCCGTRKKLNLNERIYYCDVCGLEIDRDVNAAINLEHYNYK
nr:transposase [uncultured phage]CAI9752316.1 transposase [uncultured phage]